ncbi:hypothetical protein C8N25_107143 [Algoriphagus antarcticus]|uniref:Uncharacterized protein n=1 Tax=Algoriphagus antarcticus TaxID=238540 RepID=A0A3E0DY64_9BACT|nr:hypothetical protein C8N25_107143 [Algoriphagus antarcticus]
MVDRSQIQVGFQGSERILYLSDGVVNVPDDVLFLNIQVGAQEVNAQVVIFFLMLAGIFFPGDCCCQPCFLIIADGNVIIGLNRRAFLFGSAYPLMDFIGLFYSSLAVQPCGSFAVLLQTFFQTEASCLPPSFPWKGF